MGSYPEGVITDPCDGDSGGPLAILRDGRWQLVGVLKVIQDFPVESRMYHQGEGYDCGRDSFNGDGLWSNVAGQREWVESQMLDGLTLGLPAQLNSVSLVLSCSAHFT